MDASHTQGFLRGVKCSRVSCACLHESRSLPSASPGAEQRSPWPGGTRPPLAQPGQPAGQRAGPRGHTWPAGPAGTGPSWRWLNAGLRQPAPGWLPGLQGDRAPAINMQWHRNWGTTKRRTRICTHRNSWGFKNTSPGGRKDLLQLIE